MDRSLVEIIRDYKRELEANNKTEMALKEKNIDQFIELRVKGLSFDKIALELKISKPTLLKWNKEREVAETIKAMQLMQYQSILKLYQMDRNSRIERFSKLAKKINEEFEKRDLSELPTEKLFKLAVLNEKRLIESIPVELYHNRWDENWASEYFEFNPFD